MGIYENAKSICAILSKKGFIAYFAGGFVRDMLLGIPSNDIDIATNASPEQITHLFPDHILVGTRFGVVIVKHNSETFEVTSFRSDAHYIDGRHPTSITLTGSPEEDAARRDFTINGMFFDPETHIILDFVGGKIDLENRLLRTIGNPLDRFSEDKLRMIRAVRFAVRFCFHIDSKTEEAIKILAPSLFPAVSIERVLLELTKMHTHNIYKALILLRHVGLLQIIFPPLESVSEEELRKRLAPIEHLNPSFPLILVLAALFSSKDDAFVKNLPTYLKTAKIEEKWIEMWQQIRSCDIEHLSDYLLAHLFANPYFFPCFSLHLEYHTPEEKMRLHSWYKKKFHELLYFIERISHKMPLIKAEDLISLGISPGPLMGKLLREAEEISINNHLKEKENVLNFLREKLKK